MKLKIILIINLILSSCTKQRIFTDIDPRFKKNLVKTDDFYLTYYEKEYKDKNKPFIVYLEGDGKVTKNRIISKDPTPENKLVLKLASEDKRPNIIYLARPCQYTSMSLNPKCNSEYWTSKRWAKECVISMNQALNSLTDDKDVYLVGFSGGGGMAILLGAINKKIKHITTIAGNLDIEAFNKFHNCHACKESLNPINFANKTKHIPQIHISGKLDKIVPEMIADRFIDEYNKNCKHECSFRPLKIVCNTCTHSNEDWVSFWQSILDKYFDESFDAKNFKEPILY